MSGCRWSFEECICYCCRYGVAATLCIAFYIVMYVVLTAGAFEGMGYGMNGAAMLITRGCKEMNRLAIAMGAQPHTMRLVHQ